MVNLSCAVRVYLHIAAVDMRKSFNGLYALAKHEMNKNPMDGSLFVFSNRNRTMVKILFFDGTGLWVMAKRLDGARQRVDGFGPEGVRNAGALWAA